MASTEHLETSQVAAEDVAERAAPGDLGSADGHGKS